jgi:hypothetical protein
MPKLKQIAGQALIFAAFVATSFVSVNLAFGALYCLVFIAGAFRKERANNSTIFFVSLFLDARSFAPPGITFVSVAILYALCRRFKISFQIFGIVVGYLFAFLCCCKLLSSVFVVLAGYRFDAFSNLMQILWTLFAYTIYNGVARRS